MDIQGIKSVAYIFIFTTDGLLIIQERGLLGFRTAVDENLLQAERSFQTFKVNSLELLSSIQ